MGSVRRWPRGATAGRQEVAMGRLPWLAQLTAVLALGSLLLGGCAPIRGWSSQELQSRGPTLQEDAGPRIYDEDQVDVPARPIAPIRPVYPPRMRALGVPGEVEARVIVRSDGSCGGGRIVGTTNDDFTASARKAIRAARFHPALRAGRPVASWVTLRVHFELDR